MPQCWRPKAVLCAFLLRVWENASAHKRSPFYDMGSAEDLELKGLRCRGGFIVTEYIERGALDRALTIAAANGKDKDRRTWAKAICVLHDMPVVDVAPVVHGEWIFGEIWPVGCTVKCSACGWGLNSVDPVLWVDYAGHNYCGSCGAKMDGGASNAPD